MYFPLKKNPTKTVQTGQKPHRQKHVSVIVQGILNEITPNFKTRLQYCYHNDRWIRFYVLNTGVNIHAHASFPMFLPNRVTQWVRAFILLVLYESVMQITY